MHFCISGKDYLSNMTSNSLIDVGKLSEPATELVKRVSDAVGGILKPWQTERVAKAEAKADRIKTLEGIKTSQLGYRAIKRFYNEEIQKQKNIENITTKSLPKLLPQAKPENIEKDWIVNFFDKSRIVSDEDMQSLWAKILAGEANSPGKFSKRTINFMASLDKKDAEMFTKLCNFGWNVGGLTPLIYDSDNKIYTDNGINFGNLNHMSSVGLISFETLTGYRRLGLKQKGVITYGKNIVMIEFQKDKDNEIDIGKVLLTSIGQELSVICEKTEIQGFVDYVIDHLKPKVLNIYPINFSTITNAPK